MGGRGGGQAMVLVERYVSDISPRLVERVIGLGLEGC